MSLAAREVVDRYGGHFPAEREALESLSGIGPYTAGAIASIAHGREEALVDGNVSRVLARVFAIRHALGSKAAKEVFWARAAELVLGERPGDLNQSLMELGALVCLPRHPRCDACPVAAMCVAHANGEEQSLPVAKPKRLVSRVDLDAFVIKRGRSVLLAKRPPTGLFAGLWEPPMTAPNDARTWLSGTRTTPRPVGEVRHVLTHRVLEVRVFALSVRRMALHGLPTPYVAQQWLECDRMGDRAVGLSTLARRVLELAGVVDDVARRRDPPGKRGHPIKTRMG